MSNTIEESINKINKEILTINDSNKLKHILQKHKKASEEISDVKTKIDKLFDTLNKCMIDVSTNEIDIETYEKNIKCISQMMETFDKEPIETQIKNYELLNNKINDCLNFLNLKKMEIINCDETKLLSDEENDSENSD